jgi:hypothetical protein
MQRSPRTAAVRLSLWALLIASFAMALVQPVQAQAVGFADVTFTVAVTDAADATPVLASHDITEVALGEPGDDSLVFRGTLAGPALPVEGTGVLYFGFTAAGTDVVGGCTFEGAPDTRNIGEPIPPTACLVEGNLIYATYAYDGIDVAVGDVVSQIWAFTDACAPGAGCLPLDTAPGGLAEAWPATAFGTDYTLTGCSKAAGCGGGSTNPNDTDNDGLNDTCEQEYFSDLTHNATEDADGDGLTNLQECQNGTDPTKADSDGDGVNDKDDPFPNDPTKGGNTTTSSSSSSTSRTSSSSTTTTSRSSSTTASNAGNEGDDGDVENFGDAVERLKADPGYVGLSSGGFLAVLVLCIIALAVRWSL